jgi:probable rRNA maturation factor
VTVAARAPEVSRRSVEAWVQSVLAAEGHRSASLSVTFLSEPQMEALNRRARQVAGSTDVIAFRFEHAKALVGDVYVCPAVARRSARAEGVAAAQELLRLVVHGVLHVCGYEHPNDHSRTRSTMWKLQEQYVQHLAGSGAA